MSQPKQATTNKNDQPAHDHSASNHNEVGSDTMTDSPMMARLLDEMKKGTDVGHYGRLTFAMVARHFMDEQDIIDLMAKQPDQDEAKARAMFTQVQQRDYNPPKRERIIEWQAQQDFQICSTPDDESTCNLYRELRFPDTIYSNITDYYEEHTDNAQA